ncbi:MAG: pyrroline-5-carboxylate reductase [Alphaproteobacteria bacterium]|nr:pyrroline-5-carboxylate reductase [Alphaproteobacteria bacterium]
MSTAAGEEKEASLKRAVLFGAGRMGWAMARGWLADLAAAGLVRLDIVEPSPGEEVVAAAGAGRIRLNGDPAQADIVILAVKPQGFSDTAPAVLDWVGPDTLVVSILAGATLERIVTALGSPRTVRAMPNTPGAIGKGVTGYAASPACSDTDRAAAEKLLTPLGAVVGPLDEAMIDAVTAVSGSGPAYVFLLAESLEAAALEAGLDAATAALLARKTVAGAGALLEAGGDPAVLRKAVTSPGGTTAAALKVLMAKGGMADLMGEAVDAARRRASELSRELDLTDRGRL